jgi:hypothetical protein
MVPGLHSPVAIYDRHFRDSCHYYDRGTSEGVKRLLILRYGLALSGTFPCDRKDNIVWECANGGQLWTTSAAAGYGSGNIPAEFCTTGFSSLYTVFVVCLLGDIACQVRSSETTWWIAT